MSSAVRAAREEADPSLPAGGIAGGAKGRPGTTMARTPTNRIAPVRHRASNTPIRRSDDDTHRQIAIDVIARFGGRFSTQVGIDLDPDNHDDLEIERWFLAATLFGNRIGSNIALRTYRVLDGLGLSTIGDLASCERDDLVDFLDRGKYVHYDYRMASRLLALTEHAPRVLPDGVSALVNRIDHPERLRVTLEALPGWGPVTTRAFLRELRGICPGADLPVDPLAASSACHLGLSDDDTAFDVARLLQDADLAGVDVRDLEVALVRVALAHHRSFDTCEMRSPGHCELLGDDDRHLHGFPIAPRNGERNRRVVSISSRTRTGR